MTHNFDKPCGADNSSNLNMVKLDPKYSSGGSRNMVIKNNNYSSNIMKEEHETKLKKPD